MKQQFNNGQEYLMVDKIPAGAGNFKLDHPSNQWRLLFDKEPYVIYLGLHVDFVPDLQILFLASEATEEQAGEVVDKIKNWPTDLYYDYTAGGRDFRDIVEAAFKNPIESLRSLLSSHGMEGETLFLKKIK